MKVINRNGKIYSNDIIVDVYKGNELCWKIKPESKFFPIGDLDSTMDTIFDTARGGVLETVTKNHKKLHQNNSV